MIKQNNRGKEVHRFGKKNPLVGTVNPNVAYPRRGKTRQSEADVGARRLGQYEQYLTVREILSEASTLADGALSRERRDFYRFGYATLGSRIGQQEKTE